MNEPLDIDRDGMLDSTPLVFGKYKGKTPNWIVDNCSERDASWLVWAYENVSNFPVCSAALYKSLGGTGRRAAGARELTPQQRTMTPPATGGKMAAANDMDDDIPF